MKNINFKIPRKLICEIQYYKWGGKNESAFIPEFLGIEKEADKPYAELWIGAHPKAPSKLELDGGFFKLNELIEKYPAEILGKRVAQKFNGQLPFLLKTLSANQALSIQAHPDKKLAEILHKKDPEHYPDDNHKPEIAVALDKLTALAGFRPYREILSAFDEYPELLELFDNDLIGRIKSAAEFDENNLVKEIYSKIIRCGGSALSNVIGALFKRIDAKRNRTLREKQFLTQFSLYGFDVGLISIFLFNLLELRPYQAFYTGAGIPHAYLEGNIIECMANSDNVVRAGLTPKYKDVETLLELIDYKPAGTPVIERDGSSEFTYKTEAEEFELKSVIKRADEKFSLKNDSVNICLMIAGEGKISGNNFNFRINRGEAVLIPAAAGKVNFEFFKDSHLIIAGVPE